MYNSKRGEEVMDSLNTMLLLIDEVSKNTEGFHVLQELLPLMGELRRADIEGKEMGESLKIIGEMLPKLKGKMFPSGRGGEAPYEVYDRMVSHLTLELGKLNSEYEDIVGKATQAESGQEEQVKAETAQIIKQIEQVLTCNRKVISATIAAKRKEYLNPDHSHHYLHRQLETEIKGRNILRQKLEECKYQFGEYRNKFIQYDPSNQSHQVKADMQKLSYGRETGMSQEMVARLQNKIQLERRKEFLRKGQQHIKRQFPFVLSNLRKLQSLNGSGKYEQNLYHHYFNWARRIKVMLQSMLIRLSSFQTHRLTLKEEQPFLSLCREHCLKYESMLHQLSQVLK